MATISFTNKVSLSKREAKKLVKILSEKKEKPTTFKVPKHQTLQGADLKNFLNLK